MLKLNTRLKKSKFKNIDFKDLLTKVRLNRLTSKHLKDYLVLKTVHRKYENIIIYQWTNL